MENNAAKENLGSLTDWKISRTLQTYCSQQFLSRPSLNHLRVKRQCNCFYSSIMTMLSLICAFKFVDEHVKFCQVYQDLNDRNCIIITPYVLPQRLTKIIKIYCTTTNSNSPSTPPRSPNSTHYRKLVPAISPEVQHCHWVERRIENTWLLKGIAVLFGCKSKTILYMISVPMQGLLSTIVV